MPPKKKALRELGKPVQFGDKWRAQMKIDAKTFHGPRRSSQAHAEEDLEKLRSAESREGVARIAQESGIWKWGNLEGREKRAQGPRGGGSPPGVYVWGEGGTLGNHLGRSARS